MGSHVRNVLGKDLASIVGKYLLPDKNEMKNLYSSIITDKCIIHNIYKDPSIISQYYYFQLRRVYGNYLHLTFLEKYDEDENYNKDENIVGIFYDTQDYSHIRRMLNDDYSSHINSYILTDRLRRTVRLNIKLEDISYSDIIKCEDKKIKDLWVKKRKSKRNYLIEEN